VITADNVVESEDLIGDAPQEIIEKKEVTPTDSASIIEEDIEFDDEQVF